MGTSLRLTLALAASLLLGAAPLCQGQAAPSTGSLPGFLRRFLRMAGGGQQGRRLDQTTILDFAMEFDAQKPRQCDRRLGQADDEYHDGDDDELEVTVPLSGETKVLVSDCGDCNATVTDSDGACGDQTAALEVPKAEFAALRIMAIRPPGKFRKGGTVTITMCSNNLDDQTCKTATLDGIVTDVTEVVTNWGDGENFWTVTTNGVKQGNVFELKAVEEDEAEQSEIGSQAGEAADAVDDGPGVEEAAGHELEVLASVPEEHQEDEELADEADSSVSVAVGIGSGVAGGLGLLAAAAYVVKKARGRS